MKQLVKFLQCIVCLVVLPIIYSCNGSALGVNKAGPTKISKPANTNAEQVKLSDEEQFRLFLKKFKNAVKVVNRTDLITMFSFPLQTAPQWTNDELKSATIDTKYGLLTKEEFPQYFNYIFTKDAIKMIPASVENDLSEIDKTTVENYYLSLKQLTDKGSTLYELEKQYTEDNGKETSFGFVFGKVKGTYKVISYYRPWPLK